MKLFIIVILVFFVSNKSYSQADFIEWSSDSKIKWSDFQGKADAYSPYAAISAVGINFKYNSWSNGSVYKITFKINSRFDKTKSWSRRELQSGFILKHEQVHFDIAEIVSRKFRNEAEHTIYSKDYKNEIIQIFDRNMQELQKLQQKYDEQTDHSKNKVKQKEWENLVQRELLK